MYLCVCVRSSVPLATLEYKSPCDENIMCSHSSIVLTFRISLGVGNPLAKMTLTVAAVYPVILVSYEGLSNLMTERGVGCGCVGVVGWGGVGVGGKSG